MREENQSSKLAKMKANLQKLLKKSWVLPAVYLGFAAVVLSTVIWLQGIDQQLSEEAPNAESTETGVGANLEEAVPVAKVSEVIKKPIINEKEAKIVGYYFDFNATEEQQQAALVLYDNTYRQNKGLDFAIESGETFDVVAALSGTVVKAEKDGLLGNVVHIEHDNQVVTVYQSLEGLNVEEGQTVKQGDIIGQAGRNLYNKDAGIHVHFEIQQNGVQVNPNEYFNQPTSAISVDEAEEPGEDEKEKLEQPIDEKNESKNPADEKKEQEDPADKKDEKDEQEDATNEKSELKNPTTDEKNELEEPKSNQTELQG